MTKHQDDALFPARVLRRVPMRMARCKLFSKPGRSSRSDHLPRLLKLLKSSSSLRQGDHMDKRMELRASPGELAFASVWTAVILYFALQAAVH